ncbi:integrase, partial [Methylobacterium sp. J-026]|uniref:DUF6538 domain-containing protein n=1 Tax=Methylobacterium sp. J-026 TaxID=2836624 RepID=UPI001FBA4A06
MARPFKSPNGIYWLRKRVPNALRPLVGKLEIKQSLGTRDPVEAKRLHAEALARLERQWANLQQGPGTLSEREAHAIAAPIETWLVNQHADNPRRQTLWDPTLGADLWASTAPSLPPSSSDTSLLTFDLTFMQRRPMQEWCLTTADACLGTQGLQVDEAGRLLLAEAIAMAMQRGAETLQRYARGDYGNPAAVSDRPIPLSPSPTAAAVPSGPAVTFRDLASGWIKERQPAEKTRYTFPRVLDELAAFLGHDDAALLSGGDLVRWKEALLDQGLAGSTIRNGKLGPVRTILQWGVDNKRLSANAATRVGVSTKAKASEGKIPFSDAEASLILGAAAAERDPIYRWVPWLCAYTGA